MLLPLLQNNLLASDGAPQQPYGGAFSPLSTAAMRSGLSIAVIASGLVFAPPPPAQASLAWQQPLSGAPKRPAIGDTQPSFIAPLARVPTGWQADLSIAPKRRYADYQQYPYPFYAEQIIFAGTTEGWQAELSKAPPRRNYIETQPVNPLYPLAPAVITYVEGWQAPLSVAPARASADRIQPVYPFVQVPLPTGWQSQLSVAPPLRYPVYTQPVYVFYQVTIFAAATEGWQVPLSLPPRRLMWAWTEIQPAAIFSKDGTAAEVGDIHDYIVRARRRGRR